MAFSETERSRLLNEPARSEFEEASPLYAAIVRYLAEHPEAIDLLQDVPEEKQNLVTLLAAVHYLVLNGEGDELTRIYDAPSSRYSLEDAGRQFVQFCDDWRDELIEVINDHSVRANEVNRCIGLLPALMIAHRESRKPLFLIELGAVAGLNLLFDRFRYDYAGGPVIGPPGATVRLGSQLRGRVPRMDSTPPPVDQSIGIDSDPVDVNDDEAILWLRACIWVGDVARDQRFTSAVALAHREWPRVVEGEALTVLPTLIEDIPDEDEVELCIVSAEVFSSMEIAEREQLAAKIREISLSRSVWWISYELPGSIPGLNEIESSDEISFILGIQHLSPAISDSKTLAVVHRYGSWLDWSDDATSAW